MLEFWEWLYLSTCLPEWLSPYPIPEVWFKAYGSECNKLKG